MKKQLILFVVCLILGTSVYAQSKKINSYCGKYAVEDRIATITALDDSSLMVTCEYGTVILQKESEDAFTISEMTGGLVEFIKNKEGKIIEAHITIDDQDIDLRAKKVNETTALNKIQQNAMASK